MNEKRDIEKVIRKVQKRHPTVSFENALVMAIQTVLPEFYEDHCHLLGNPYSRSFFFLFFDSFLQKRGNDKIAYLVVASALVV